MELLFFIIFVSVLFQVIKKLDKSGLSTSIKESNDFFKETNHFLSDTYRNAKDSIQDLYNSEPEIIFSKEKKEYFKSVKWNTIRQKVLHRDNYACILCGSGVPYTELHIHHITYKNLFNEKINELKTVCLSCHNNIHETLGFPSKDSSIYKTEYFWSNDLNIQEQKTKDELKQMIKFI